ncbi:hypothetical protein [Rubrolithibacter danxiaensis]|uniref:hypothetical protein n=1 Tax=Rubrolithibacter danxiaensis TaxID=3390805 RepID=UPI003BF8F75A
MKVSKKSSLEKLLERFDKELKQSLKQDLQLFKISKDSFFSKSAKDVINNDGLLVA